MDADDVIWQAAGEQGVAPRPALDDAPPWVRKMLANWLRLRAYSCGHATSIVIRAFGHRHAMCPPCATLRDIPGYLRNCGNCGAVVDQRGRGFVFSLVERVLVMATICGTCWNGKKE